MSAPRLNGNPRLRLRTDAAIERQRSYCRDANSRYRTKAVERPSLLLLAVLGITILAAFLAISGPGSGFFENAAANVDSAINDYIDTKEKSTPRAEWEKGTMPYLYQTDEAWANKAYGGGHISDYGCGPTCMSMVYVYLTGSKSFSPDKMARFSERNGFIDQGVTSWLFMSEGTRKLGLESQELGADPALVKRCLERGDPVICSVRPGDFTTDGHFIVLCGVNDDGTIEIRDPNSAENSHRRWDINTIIDQCANIWRISV